MCSSIEGVKEKGVYMFGFGRRRGDEAPRSYYLPSENARALLEDVVASIGDHAPDFKYLYIGFGRWCELPAHTWSIEIIGKNNEKLSYDYRRHGFDVSDATLKSGLARWLAERLQEITEGELYVHRVRVSYPDYRLSDDWKESYYCVIANDGIAEWEEKKRRAQAMRTV